MSEYSGPGKTGMSYPFEKLSETNWNTTFRQTFLNWAMAYGDVGEALETGQYPTFTMPEPDAIRTVRRTVIEKDEDGEDVEVERLLVERQYPDTAFGASVFLSDRDRVIKKQEKFNSMRRELFSKMLLAMEPRVELAVTQHPDYENIRVNKDVIGMFRIMRECSTGQGEHSPYAYVTKLLRHKQKGEDIAGFNKEFKEIVADIIRLGDEKTVLKLIFNALYIAGLNQEQFKDQLQRIYGSRKWPDYEVLSAELMTYAIAMKGVNDLQKDSGSAIIMGNKGTVTDDMPCYNCGRKGHRGRNCMKPKNKCGLCGRLGHLDEFCWGSEKSEGHENGASRDHGRRPEHKSGHDDIRGKKQGAKRNEEKTSNKNKRGNKPKKKHVQARSALTEGEDAEGEEYEDYEDNYEYEEGDEYEGSQACLTKVTYDLQECEIKTYVTDVRSDADDPIFRLDTACIGGSVCNDPSLLDNCKTGKGASVQGITGHRMSATHSGELGNAGRTFCIPHVEDNLLSLRELTKRGYTFRGDNECLNIYDKNGNLCLTGNDEGDGFWSVRYSSVKALLNRNVSLADNTTQFFSTEDRNRAEQAYNLCAQLGHPGSTSLLNALDQGAFATSHLTSKDVRNALALFGPCLGCIEGKMTAPREPRSQSQPAEHIGECLHMDLVPLQGVSIGDVKGLLFGVDEKTGYAAASTLTTKSAASVMKAAKHIIAEFNQFGHRVRRVIFDDEAVLRAVKVPLGELGVESSHTPPGLHQKRAERYIRTMKERMRAVQASLTYELPEKLHAELALSVIADMNRLPNSVTMIISPYQAVSGRKPQVPEHRFGQTGIFHFKRLGVHTEWGIYLGMQDGHHKYYRAYLPTRNAIYGSRRFVADDRFPTEWDLKPKIRPKPRSNPQLNPNIFPVQPPLPNHLIQFDDPPDHPPSLINLPPPPVPTDPSFHQEGAVTTYVESVTPEATTDTATNAESMDQHKAPDATLEPPRRLEPVDPPRITATVEAEPQTSQSGKRSSNARNVHRTTTKPAVQPAVGTRQMPARRAKDPVQRQAYIEKGLLSRVQQECAAKVYRITVKQALKDKSKLGITTKAIMDECKQLLDSGCLDGLHPQNIPKRYRGSIVRAHMFLKDKTLSDGRFDKRKARMVANGNEEDEELIGETNSPTVNPISVNMQLAIAAKLRSTKSSYDIKGAFLKTPVEYERVGKRLFVKVGPDLAEFFIRLRPELRQCTDTKGNLYFEVKRWLYGYSEASREFNVLLDGRLKDIGFKPTKGDPCLYTRRETNGQLSMVSTHVDDLLVTTPSEAIRDKFEKDFGRYFDLNAQHENMSYLGMNITTHANGDISVKQDGYTRDLLKRYLGNAQVKKPPATPAGPDLFAIDQSPSCNRTEYLSKVMSLMFLARFTRPDILMPVTVLATRSANPTQSDMAKVMRVVYYLAGTVGRGYRYRHNVELLFTSYADAAHCIHLDGRGHGGMTLLLGGSPIFCRSIKLKCTTRSSSESELVMLDEASTYVSWCRDMLHDMGVVQSTPTTLYQDNLSTIIMATNGGTFKRTKHMLNKHAYVRERIQNGDILLKYKPTEFMVADLLTKPVPKARFQMLTKMLGLRD
jgi:hypothetical protein